MAKAKKGTGVKTEAGIEIQIGDLVKLPDGVIGTVAEVEPDVIRVNLPGNAFGFRKPSEVVIMEWSHGHGLNSRHGPDCPSTSNVIREHWPFREARYVAIGFSAGMLGWGRGFTREEAIANMKGAGYRKSGKAVLYIMPEGAENPTVDNLGAVHWTWAEGADREAKPERIDL